MRRCSIFIYRNIKIFINSHCGFRWATITGIIAIAIDACCRVIRKSIGITTINRVIGE